MLNSTAGCYSNTDIQGIDRFSRFTMYLDHRSRPRHCSAFLADSRAGRGRWRGRGQAGRGTAGTAPIPPQPQPPALQRGRTVLPPALARPRPLLLTKTSNINLTVYQPLWSSGRLGRPAGCGVRGKRSVPGSCKSPLYPGNLVPYPGSPACTVRSQ